MVFERTAGRVTSWGGLSGGSQGSRQPSTVGKKQTQPSLSSNQLLSRTSRLGSSCESENSWKNITWLAGVGLQGVEVSRDSKVTKCSCLSPFVAVSLARGLPTVPSARLVRCEKVLMHTIGLLLGGVSQWKCVSLGLDSYSMRGNNLSVDHGRLLKTMS